MKNLLSPVASPRLIENRSPRRIVPGEQIGEAPDSSPAKRRVHLGSDRNLAEVNCARTDGSLREPPYVNSTAEFAFGSTFLNQTTAEDTSASANCTSLDSNR